MPTHVTDTENQTLGGARRGRRARERPRAARDRARVARAEEESRSSESASGCSRAPWRSASTGSASSATITAGLATFLPVWLSLSSSPSSCSRRPPLAYLGARSVSRGTPPLPQQAIDEAKLTTQALEEQWQRVTRALPNRFGPRSSPSASVSPTRWTSLRAEVKEATDIRSKVQRNLPVVAAGAVGAGFILAGGIGATMRRLHAEVARGRKGPLRPLLLCRPRLIPAPKSAVSHGARGGSPFREGCRQASARRRQFVADDCMGLAQQVAFGALLAFFPALILLIGLLGLFGRRPTTRSATDRPRRTQPGQRCDRDW